MLISRNRLAVVVLVSNQKAYIIQAIMKASKKLISNSNDVLDVHATMRKIIIRQRLAPLFAFVVLVAISLVAVFFISRINSEVYRTIIQVSFTVLSIISFAAIVWLDQSLRDRDMFKVTKALHPDLFEHIRANVTRIIQEGRSDEEILTQSSGERASPSR